MSTINNPLYRQNRKAFAEGYASYLRNHKPIGYANWVKFNNGRNATSEEAATDYMDGIKAYEFISMGSSKEAFECGEIAAQEALEAFMNDDDKYIPE